MQRNYDLVTTAFIEVYTFANVLKYLYSLFDIYTNLEITPNYKYRSEKAHKFLIKFPKDKTYDHGGFVTETP